MADCILMQLGSNFHWDQTCKTCKCMQSGMQDLHWIKLSKLAIPVSRKGPGVQTIRLPFWEVDGLKATEYNPAPSPSGHPLLSGLRPESYRNSTEFYLPSKSKLPC